MVGLDQENEVKVSRLRLKTTQEIIYVRLPLDIIKDFIPR